MKKLRTSYLWNHFEEIDEGVNRKGRCRYCNDLLSIQLGATGNLTRHLKAKHPKIQTEARKPHNTYLMVATEVISRHHVTEQLANSSSNVIDLGPPADFNLSDPLRNSQPSSSCHKNGRRRSLIWEHFEEIGEDRNLRARCKHCNQMLSIPCRVTGNLIRHLYAKHPTVSFERTPRKSRKKQLEQTENSQTGEIEYVVHCDNDQVYIFENTGEETVIDEQNMENVEIVEEEMEEVEELQAIPEEPEITQKIEIEFSDFEGYSNYITMKLQNLAPEQRSYAQKIIEETIDHAENCNLNPNSCVDLIGMIS